MSKLLKLEFVKQRHKKLWLILLILLGAEFFWSLWAMNSYSRHGMEDMWKYLFYQLPMINCIVFPVLVAVVASFIADVEHRGQGLKMLAAVASQGKLYDAKFLCGACYLFLVIAGQILCMILIGKAMGFPGDFPEREFFYHGFSTLLTSLWILALQQALSILIKNQMISLVAGLAGGFLALMMMFFPPTLQSFFLWSYYSRLSTVSAIYDEAANTLQMSFTDMNVTAAVVLAAALAAVYGAGRAAFMRTEV